MGKKKSKSEQVDRHHILPGSRVPSRKLDKTNIKLVPKSYHRAYHHLFSNMTPDEVIEYLKEVWFSDEKFITPNEWLQSLAEL